MTKRRSRSRSERSRKGTRPRSTGQLLQGPAGELRELARRGLSALGQGLGAHRAEAGGLVMVLLGILTFLVLISPTQGALGLSWLGLLRFLFGWGMILFPLLLLAVGLWLLLRRFETELPELELEQVVGVALMALGLFALLQALEGSWSIDSGMAAARAGRGGGLIGTTLWAGLVGGFGVAGGALILATVFVLGGAYTSGAGPLVLLEWSANVARRTRARVETWLQRRRPEALQELAGGLPGKASEVADIVPGAAADKPEPGQGAPATSRAAAAEELRWKLPDPAELLEPGEDGTADHAFDRDRARLIEETLASFGAPAKVVEINRGPTITQFGVEPDFVQGRGSRKVKVKVSKINSLADDLALALAAPSIRIEAPVPGKGFVGIEVPNPEISLVALRDIMESKAFAGLSSRLRLGLGRDVSGSPVAADLTAMPHLLIAGTTGSGKSVCINAIIACLLLQNTPAQMRFIMVDPKRVELTFYNGIPHLLAPVIMDLDRVVPILGWISREMDERYRRFSEVGVRNLLDYNAKMRQAGERELPYLVLIVDELADLMMMAPDETERVLTRLAQLARATGIHLVIATQRPSVDVVTGLIKANFPARIAFAVASSIDSRVILDQPGAERLLGRGDMLFQAPDAPTPQRLQGVYVSEPELLRLIRYWKSDSVESPAASSSNAEPPVAAPLKQAPLWQEIEEQEHEAAEDEIFGEAVALVRRRKRASISMLQRRLRIGYTRAARLIDEMERRGIVGPEPGGSKARKVLDFGEGVQGAT